MSVEVVYALHVGHLVACDYSLLHAEMFLGNVFLNIYMYFFK